MISFHRARREILASFPGLLHGQFLIAYSMWWRRPGKSSHMIHGTAVNRFHASSQYAKSCKRPILDSVLAAKMGQMLVESYTKRMKPT